MAIWSAGSLLLGACASSLILPRRVAFAFLLCGEYHTERTRVDIAGVAARLAKAAAVEDKVRNMVSVYVCVSVCAVGLFRMGRW